MLRRTLPILLLAFAVGALFRFGNQYGIPALRMFGTWGIVAIGLIGARNLRMLQTRSGLQELEEALRTLPPGVKLAEAPLAGGPAWVLTGSKGKLVLGTSDLANSVRGARAARALKQQAVRAVNAAFQAGLLHHGDRAAAAVVLLRKRVKEEERSLAVEGLPDPVLLLNAEEVGALLEQLA